MSTVELIRNNKGIAERALWHASSMEYANIVRDDSALRDYISSFLGWRFNDLEIHRGIDMINLIIYLNPPFEQFTQEHASIAALKKSLLWVTGQSLNYNISVYFINVAKAKYNRRKHIYSLTLNRFEKSSKLLSDYISYKVGKEIKNRKFFKRIQHFFLKFLIKGGNHNLLGLFVKCSGPFKKSSMARTVSIRKGRVPLNSFNSPISYHKGTSHTIYGSFGVKVWVHHRV